MVFDPAEVQEQIVIAVVVLSVAPAATDSHGKQVHRVTVPVRGEVNRALEKGAILVPALVPDVPRDIETIVTITPLEPAVVLTVMSIRSLVVTIEAFVLLVMPMSLFDPVAVVSTIVRLGGDGEGQRERERGGGNGDSGDVSHGKASFNTRGYCQNRAKSASTRFNQFKINLLRDFSRSRVGPGTAWSVLVRGRRRGNLDLSRCVS